MMDAFSSLSRNSAVQRVYLNCQQVSARAGSRQQNCTDAPVSKGPGSAGYIKWQKGNTLPDCSGLKTSKHNKGQQFGFASLTLSQPDSLNEQE